MVTLRRAGDIYMNKRHCREKWVNKNFAEIKGFTSSGDLDERDGAALRRGAKAANSDDAGVGRRQLLQVGLDLVVAVVFGEGDGAAHAVGGGHQLAHLLGVDGPATNKSHINSLHLNYLSYGIRESERAYLLGGDGLQAIDAVALQGLVAGGEHRQAGDEQKRQYATHLGKATSYTANCSDKTRSVLHAKRHNGQADPCHPHAEGLDQKHQLERSHGLRGHSVGHGVPSERRVLRVVAEVELELVLAGLGHQAALHDPLDEAPDAVVLGPEASAGEVGVLRADDALAGAVQQRVAVLRGVRMALHQRQRERRRHHRLVARRHHARHLAEVPRPLGLARQVRQQPLAAPLARRPRLQPPLRVDDGYGRIHFFQGVDLVLVRRRDDEARERPGDRVPNEKSEKTQRYHETAITRRRRERGRRRGRRRGVGAGAEGLRGGQGRGEGGGRGGGGGAEAAVEAGRARWQGRGEGGEGGEEGEGRDGDGEAAAVRRQRQRPWAEVRIFRIVDDSRAP
ncbi:Protein of unknown function [Gryllus bimaculatus]|nr:Protein of unknown function [Gryllus bimaculatus]